MLFVAGAEGGMITWEEEEEEEEEESCANDL